MSSSTFNENYQKKISRWVELDDRITTRTAKLKIYKDEKKELEDDILRYVEEGELENIKINVDDSKILFEQTSTIGTISLKLLRDRLQKYFSSHKTASADDIYKFIVDSREVKNKLVMKRVFGN
jgi:Fe-S cluster assembly scaffold protein SufB